MSMTIHSTIVGVTDLTLFLEALQHMGFAVKKPKGSSITAPEKKKLAETWIQGRKISITRNKQSGDLELVGDSDWRFMKDKAFRDQLRQQYGVAAVKRKARTMNYRIFSVTTREDGSIQILARAWG